MGTDFFLACAACAEFVHVPDRRPLLDAARSLLARQTWAEGVVLDPAQLHDAPGIAPFADRHADHDLCLLCDIGDLPWELGTDGWDRWREVGTDHHALLPRNLVGDLGLRTWPQALDHLARTNAWMLHPQLAEPLEELRVAFLAAVGRT